MPPQSANVLADAVPLRAIDAAIVAKIAEVRKN
jgi:hypothetical protein